MGETTDRFEASDPWLKAMELESGEAIKRIATLGSQERAARHDYKNKVNAEFGLLFQRLEVVENEAEEARESRRGLHEKMDEVSKSVTQIATAVIGDEFGNEGLIKRQNDTKRRISSVEDKVDSLAAHTVTEQRNALWELFKVLGPAIIMGVGVIGYLAVNGGS